MGTDQYFTLENVYWKLRRSISIFGIKHKTQILVGWMCWMSELSFWVVIYAPLKRHGTSHTCYLSMSWCQSARRVMAGIVDWSTVQAEGNTGGMY